MLPVQYPDKNDQRRLAEAGGLTLKQTTNWVNAQRENITCSCFAWTLQFTNTRKRFWQPQTKPGECTCWPRLPRLLTPLVRCAAGRGRNSRTTGTLREEEFAAHAAQEDKTAALEGEVVEVADEADEVGRRLQAPRFVRLMVCVVCRTATRT